MLKKITWYIIIFGGLLVVGYWGQSKVMESQNISLPFSLFNVYGFHAVFSFLICVVFSFIALKDKWFDQLGFLYLAVLVVKIAVFYGVFYSTIFALENIGKIESVSLLIPIGIFLTAEVYYIARILNAK